MKKLARVLCVLTFAIVPSFSAELLFQGTFSQDDDVALLPFDLFSPGSVTLRSYGYAGGTTPGGVLIPEGGFAPNLILFDGSGNEIGSDQGSHCAITGASSVTGNCDDSVITESLGTGHYIAALVEWDNHSNDGFLPDGFFQTGNPGFTCAEFGQSGNFCDVTTGVGTVRSGNWAVDITGATIFLPEPGGFALLLAAAGVLLARGRLRKTRAIS
jgi:hypothetical protein